MQTGDTAFKTADLSTVRVEQVGRPKGKRKRPPRPAKKKR